MVPWMWNVWKKRQISHLKNILVQGHVFSDQYRTIKNAHCLTIKKNTNTIRMITSKTAVSRNIKCSNNPIWINTGIYEKLAIYLYKNLVKIVHSVWILRTACNSILMLQQPSQQQHLLAFLETAILITEDIDVLILYGYANIS